MSREELKRKAALKAVEYVTSGMVVGLGTGSTAKFAVEEIGRKVKRGELKNILGVPTSEQTRKLALEAGIELTDFNKTQEIDLTIDGADEVDRDLNLIKGGGGALLREKIIAQATQTEIIIIDDSKLSEKLGEKFYLPVEVIPFAAALEKRFAESLGYKANLRKNKDGSLFITDENNLILDVKITELTEPEKLAERLDKRAGIVEHGLFIGIADIVVVAGEGGVRELKRGSNIIPD